MRHSTDRSFSCGGSPPTTVAFTPTAAQWRTEIVDLTSVLGQPDVLFMFVNTSDFGNDLYVDDIAIGQSVGIAENPGAFDVQVFPNPTNGRLHVTLPNDGLGRINVKVFSLDGTLVLGENWSAATGSVRDLDMSRLAKGSYLLELASEHGRIARERIVVQ